MQPYLFKAHFSYSSTKHFLPNNYDEIGNYIFSYNASFLRPEIFAPAMPPSLYFVTKEYYPAHVDAGEKFCEAQLPKILMLCQQKNHNYG